jgi:predicted kinase
MRKMLILLCGLPGSGKSTLAARLCAALSLPVVSVDLVAAAMWAGGIPREMTGPAAYAVLRAIAEEQLTLGLLVVVDAVNPTGTYRASWRSLASDQGADLVVIACICSDAALHRRRIERRRIAARRRGIPGMAEATWELVEQRRREYEPWVDDRLVLDTAPDVEAVAAAALAYVATISR